MSEICLSGRATTDRLGKANGNVNKRHELCMSANFKPSLYSCNVAGTA